MCRIFSVNQKTQIVDKREKNVEEQGFGRVKMDYEGWSRCIHGFFVCCNAYKIMTQTLEFYQRHSCSYSHVFGTKHRTQLLTSQITYPKINYFCVTETSFGRYFYQIFQVWENLLFYWSGILGLISYWVWTTEWAFGERKRLQWVFSGDLTDERREAELEKNYCVMYVVLSHYRMFELWKWMLISNWSSSDNLSELFKSKTLDSFL